MTKTKKMSIVNLVHEFQELGCKNEITCAIAARVFIDMKDGITNIDKFYNTELDIIYFRGIQNENAKVFLPVSSCRDLDLKQLENIQNALSSEEKKITLCICDPSSTILYYTVSQGSFD